MTNELTIVLPGVSGVIESYEDTSAGQLRWLLDMSEATGRWMAIADIGYDNAQQLINAVAEKWQLISMEAKARWSGNLEDWAVEATGKDKQTVKGYIDVWETWFTEAYEIDVPDYVNLRTIAPTKLLRAKGAAKRGLMTAESWQALADGNVSGRKLAETLPVLRTRTKTKELRFFEQDGYLMATNGKETWIEAMLSAEVNTPDKRRSREILLIAVGAMDGKAKD